MKIIEPYLKRKGIGDNRQPKPNVCEFIMKSRYGEYGDQRLKLWSYFNKGKFRRTDYFVTNDANEFVKIPKPTLITEF